MILPKNMFLQNMLLALWIGAMHVVQRSFVVPKYNRMNGRWELRTKLIFAVIVVIPLIYMTANRPDTFGDTSVYRWIFQRGPATIARLIRYFRSGQKDPGFLALIMLCKNLLGHDSTRFFLVIALIQALSLMAVYREHSSDYVLSIALFVFSADFLGWMYNGIRQFLACTIVFAATTLMLKRKYLWVILVILLASTIHQSALYMIPIVFIVRGRAWNWKTMILIAGAIIACVFVDTFTDVMEEVLSYTQYAESIATYKKYGDNGVHPIRAAIFAAPTVFAFIKRREVTLYGDVLINICVNMSIVTTVMYLIGVFTSGIFFGRMPIYTSLYNYILIPWELKYLVPGRMQSMAFAALVGAYLVFYFVQTHLIWGL